MNRLRASKVSTTIGLLLGLLAMPLMVSPASAAPAYTFSSTPDYMYGAYTFRQSFTVGSQNILIDALGFYDYQGDGLSGSHLMGLFDSSGNLVVSTTIGSGTGNPLASGFRWQTIADTVFTAGSTFSLVSQSTSDAHNMMQGLVLDSRLASVQSGFVGGSVFNPNLISTSTNNMIWTENFNIRDTVVPEPASLALLGLGLAGLGFSRMKRKAG